MSPEAWQEAIEFLLGDGLNHPASSALFRSKSAAEVDRAANAVSGRAGCSAWSGYFLAFLACRFSFSVF